MKKVFRNELLNGIISKDKAIEILGLEREVNTRIKNIDIVIYRDDNENINIDILEEGEAKGGAFEEIGRSL